MRCLVALLAVGVTLAVAAPSHASVIFYTNSAAFTAAAGPGLTTENFDSTPSSLVPVTTVATGLKVTSPDPNAQVSPAAFASGQSEKSTLQNGAVTFTFPTPVTAFGIDVFDLGTVGATTLTMTLSDSSSQALFSGFTSFTGNQQFAGFISTTPITSVTFSNSQSGDFVEFDNARFGGAVPEPATLGVFGVLAAGAFGLRRRKAAKA